MIEMKVRGIAVDLDFEGLLVPVIHEADGKRLTALAREISGLAAKARAKTGGRPVRPVLLRRNLEVHPAERALEISPALHAFHRSEPNVSPRRLVAVVAVRLGRTVSGSQPGDALATDRPMIGQTWNWSAQPGGAAWTASPPARETTELLSAARTSSEAPRPLRRASQSRSAQQASRWAQAQPSALRSATRTRAAPFPALASPTICLPDW